MILKHNDLMKAVKFGKVVVSPFNKTNVGPNSIDVTLANKLLVYTRPGGVLDCATLNPTQELVIPTEGLILHPGTLYLGSTVEAIGSDWYVPILEGRSSVGRLGINIHITAGFGDIGFTQPWTLEITVIHPIRIYPGIRIGQVYFLVPTGKDRPKFKYKGKYRSQIGPKASELYKDFK